MKYKKGDILLIKWIDSYSNSRWYNDEEIKDWIKQSEKDKIVSIGFLYKKTEEYIVVYSDRSSDEKARFIKIPIGMTIKIKKL